MWHDISLHSRHDFVPEFIEGHLRSRVPLTTQQKKKQKEDEEKEDDEDEEREKIQTEQKEKEREKERRKDRENEENRDVEQKEKTSQQDIRLSTGLRSFFLLFISRLLDVWSPTRDFTQYPPPLGQSIKRTPPIITSIHTWTYIYRHIHIRYIHRTRCREGRQHTENTAVSHCFYIDT